MPLRRWSTAHPLVVDALLAALVAAFALGVPGPEPARRILAPVDTPTTVLCIAGALTLVVRRRFPWPVWAGTTIFGIIGAALVAGPSRALVPAIIAVYTLAVLVPARPAIAAAVLTPLVPIAIILVVGSVGPLEAFAFGLGPWSALAAVTGIAVRSQRAVIAAAHERVRLAEETREEEARRRVSEERLRIARDLHDVVAHHIAVINVQAGVASHLMRSDPEQAAIALGHVREAGRVVLEEIPGLLGLLRADEPGAYAADGQPGAATAPAPRLADLPRLVEEARRSGLQVTTQRSGTPLEFGPGAELTAYRIVQEALTNAARHGAGAALLTESYDARGCTIEVRNRMSDSGIGARVSGQHGLTGMRERASSTGGTLTLGPDGPDDWQVSYRLDTRPSGGSV